MAKKLKTYVSVQNPEGGDFESFGPDGDLPSWAREAITNPSAWVDEEDEDKATQVNQPPTDKTVKAAPSK